MRQDLHTVLWINESRLKVCLSCKKLRRLIGFSLPRCDQVVNDAFGIESGLMTTVHSTTGASSSCGSAPVFDEQVPAPHLAYIAFGSCDCSCMCALSLVAIARILAALMQWHAVLKPCGDAGPAQPRRRRWMAPARRTGAVAAARRPTSSRRPLARPRLWARWVRPAIFFF